MHVSASTSDGLNVALDGDSNANCNWMCHTLSYMHSKNSLYSKAHEIQNETCTIMSCVMCHYACVLSMWLECIDLKPVTAFHALVAYWACFKGNTYFQYNNIANATIVQLKPADCSYFAVPACLVSSSCHWCELTTSLHGWQRVGEPACKQDLAAAHTGLSHMGYLMVLKW